MVAPSYNSEDNQVTAQAKIAPSIWSVISSSKSITISIIGNCSVGIFISQSYISLVSEIGE